MASFFTASIGRKLSTSFTLMLALIILAGIIAAIGVLSIQTSVQLSLSTGFQIKDRVHQARQAVSEVERLETFFLANYARSGLANARSVITQSVPRQVDAFESYLTEIESLAVTASTDGEIWSSGALITLMQSYYEGILQLIDAVERRGIIGPAVNTPNAEDVGYIGALRVSSAALETAIHESGSDPALLSILLELELTEANYIIRGAVEDRFQVNALINELREGIAAAVTVDDVETLDTLLEVHRTDFDTLYRQDLVIERAIQADRGTVIAIDQQLEAIEGLALQWVNEARQAIFTRVSGVLLLIGGAMVVASIAGVLLATMVTRGISRPLRHITQTTRAISAGDLSQQVNIRTRDEVGALAAAFNHMAQDLRHMMDVERARRTHLEDRVALYTGFVQRVAEGNLTARLDLAVNGQAGDQSDDLFSLGLNLNHMVEQLSQMAMQIHEAAEEVSDATEEILQAVMEQLSSAAQQEAAISETLATVTEVQTTVTHTADQARIVAATSQQSLGVSNAGQDAVEDTVAGMGNIQELVQAIANNILVLSGHTQQIGEIINAVNQIAQQSKLLALNASIEAARAGEEGRGFAVVATEIRQLADESRKATTHIRDILEEIQQATNTTVMVTEEGSKGAAAGMQLVSRAGDAIRELATVIESSALLAEQIATGTHQQAVGMDQLLAAIASIRQASIYAATSTRQTEQSAKNLNEMARRMQEAVARYRLEAIQWAVAAEAGE